MELLKREWIIHHFRNDFKIELESIHKQLENGSGVAIIKNFPIAGASEEVESNYLNFMALFGHILYQNIIGHFISHIRDVNVSIEDVIDKGIKENRTQLQTSNRPYQTNAHLEFYTELSDVAGLLCVHNAREGGDNRIVSSIAVYEEMQRNFPEELLALSESFYINHQTPLKPDGMNHLIKIPVFSNETDCFASFLLGSYIKATYESVGKNLPQIASEAIDRIQEISSREDFHIKLRLEPGDILLVNNHVTYHSRKSYIDHEEDDKRLLLRTWVSTFGNRPLHSQFSELYGHRLDENTRRGGFEKVTQTVTA